MLIYSHDLNFSRCDLHEEPEDEDELMKASYRKIKGNRKPNSKKEEVMEQVQPPTFRCYTILSFLREYFDCEPKISFAIK